jgi:phage terminase small subunit
LSLSNKRRAFVEEYLRDFNATQAALRAGYSSRTAYSQGQRLLKNVEIKAAIDERLSELKLSADEVLIGLTEQARANIGVFFKLVEEWTFYPLPTYDIIDAREIDVLDEGGEPTGEKKVNYWVRHVVIDTDRLVDPDYSKLLKKFSDSPKNGLTIELHDKQAALYKVGQHHKLWTERVDLTSGGEKITVTLTGETSD